MHAPPTADLTTSNTALLTTFRRSGAPVATPVSIVADGDRAYFTTAVDSGKARRIASNAAVTLAPCTTAGEVMGRTVAGQARLLPGTDPVRRDLLRPTRALFWSHLMYRLRRRPMGLYEVMLADQP